MFVRVIFLPYSAFRYSYTGTINFGGQHAELTSKGTSLLDLSVVPLIDGACCYCLEL